MMCQEIKIVGGNIRGTVIDKDIVDIDTGNTINWSNLLAYYSMSDIKNNITSDYSNNSNTLN